jgi:hypothetical protein
MQRHRRSTESCSGTRPIVSCRSVPSTCAPPDRSLLHAGPLHANRRGCHREASPRSARLRVAPLSRAWSRLHRRGSAPLRSARRRSALQNARSETRVPASSARAPAAPPLSTQVTCSSSLRMAAKAPFRPRPLGARPVLRGYPLLNSSSPAPSRKPGHQRAAELSLMITSGISLNASRGPGCH